MILTNNSESMLASLRSSVSGSNNEKLLLPASPSGTIRHVYVTGSSKPSVDEQQRFLKQYFKPNVNKRPSRRQKMSKVNVDESN